MDDQFLPVWDRRGEMLSYAGDKEQVLPVQMTTRAPMHQLTTVVWQFSKNSLSVSYLSAGSVEILAWKLSLSQVFCDIDEVDSHI